MVESSWQTVAANCHGQLAEQKAVAKPYKDSALCTPDSTALSDKSAIVQKEHVMLLSTRSFTPVISLLIAGACLNSAYAFVASGAALRRPNGAGQAGLLRKKHQSINMVSGEVNMLKSKIFQLAAVTDRGGMADGGKSNAYLETKNDMRALVNRLAQLEPIYTPLRAKMLSGNWELAYTTVQLFRASPFFQMVEAGYDNPEKSNLFFKLHQLQTGSWGVSSIGRITQMLELTEAGPPEEAGVSDAVITTDSDESEGATMPEAAKGLGASGSLESEVDLILLPLTSLPVVGFWKLLPTFGGCIATKAYCSVSGDNNEVVELTVQSTKLKAVQDVPLLPVAGQFFEGREFPTGDVTKAVIGKVPVTRQTVVYVDESLRIMEDKAGELFVYARPLQMD